MIRRPKGSGGVRERRPGIWELKFDLGVDPVRGTRRTRTKTFKGTKNGAERELRKVLREIDTDTYVDPSKSNVAQILDRWIQHMRRQISAKTHERYAEIVRNYLVPALGNHKIGLLKSIHIDGAYDQLLESGRADGKGGLSAQTVKHCHRVLKQALKQAVIWQVIDRNPADYVEPPRVVRKEIAVYSAAQTAQMLQKLEGHELYVPALIAVTTGLRRGEVLALRWQDIDFDRSTIQVVRSLEQTRQSGLIFKETKSKKARHVTMPSLLKTGLKDHRSQQAENLLALGIRQNNATLLNGRVRVVDGILLHGPLNPEDVSRRFPDKVVQIGLPRLTFHQLRHSHATQMLLSDVHPKVAQERLGHSSIGITMDLYSHLVPSMQAEAAEKVDNALQEALQNAHTMT